MSASSTPCGSLSPTGSGVGYQKGNGPACSGCSRCDTPRKGPPTTNEPAAAPAPCPGRRTEDATATTTGRLPIDPPPTARSPPTRKAFNDEPPREDRLHPRPRHLIRGTHHRPAGRRNGRRPDEF